MYQKAAVHMFLDREKNLLPTTVEAIEQRLNEAPEGEGSLKGMVMSGALEEIMGSDELAERFREAYEIDSDLRQAS